ncbi:MAG: VCBS repeat-containing protein [Planctomycetes bacterium]|nr:VCBS repeat-containing protein [Planctomycetota bacterium]MBL7038432.1 VCBS repeat-containing protein [Pirellulaceae bacterium]
MTRLLPNLATVAIAALPFVFSAAFSLAGEPPSLKFAKQFLMLSPNEGCAIADVDKDGDADVIAGTHWFAGPDFVPRPLRDIAEVHDVYYSSNGDYPYDVDGDGWIDVISIGWFDPELCWYRNPGKDDLDRGKKWERRVLKETRGQNEALALHDLDGDGVPEIFVNSWDKKGPVVAWKLAKDQDGNPTVEQIVLGEEGNGHGFAFGDINGDGREDLLCEAGWYERPESDPLAKPWKLHKEGALPHPSCPCIITDLNGDDRNDIIWGKAHDFGLYWWEQGEPKDDGTTTWTEHLIDDSWSQPHCLVWADLTGDGKPELITGKRVRAHCGNDPGGKDPAVLFYYTWNREAGEFCQHAIGAPGDGIGSGMQIRVGDLNADGRPDVAVGGKTGTWVMINEGTKE